jgi:hypothetical protein
VKGTMVEAAAIMSPSRSTPLLRSEAIMCDHPIVGCANHSTANRMSAAPPPCVQTQSCNANSQFTPQSRTQMRAARESNAKDGK